MSYLPGILNHVGSAAASQNGALRLPGSLPSYALLLLPGLCLGTHCIRFIAVQLQRMPMHVAKSFSVTMVTVNRSG